LRLKEKTTQHWFSYFQIALKNLVFYDWPVKIIFEDFSTNLYDCYRIEHSCLYIPYGHYCI